MSTLTIPDTGLRLESSPDSMGSLPMQAFGITLDDNMIEDMIRCVENGQSIEVTLGSNPTFYYGSREEKVTAIPESTDYDLYVTDLADQRHHTQRLPFPTMSIYKKPPAFLSAKKMSKVTTKNASRASSSGIDSDIDARAGLHAQTGGKGPKLVNGGPRGAKLLPTGRPAMANALPGTKRGSLPSSPALNGISSPNPAFSASQQVLEKNKGQRAALVHELAIKDQPLEHLRDHWIGADSEFQSTVEKVADLDKNSGKWSLKKIYWKELDVWNYDYDSPVDRQQAIESAIKVYDKQRVGTSDPVWERLLPKERRGKGIVLSKLQATIAKLSTAPPAPKTAPQKAEDGNKSDYSAKGKSEPISSSNSQATKPKKMSNRDAQTKRLLSNNPKKPAPKKPAAKVKAVAEKGKTALSEEFVYDTSTDENHPSSQGKTIAPKPKPARKPIVKPAEKPADKPADKPAEKPVEKPADKPVEKPVEKPADKPVEKPAEKLVAKANVKPKEVKASTSLKPKQQPVVRAPRAPAVRPPQKRLREDEDSSSSSGAPLSQRIKSKELPKEQPKKPILEPKVTKARVSDTIQSSRATNNTTALSNTVKSKDRSPTKASPLATTQPTNASDVVKKSSQQHRIVERDKEKERDSGSIRGPMKNLSKSKPAASSALPPSMGNRKRKAPEPDEESPDTTPTPPTKKPRLSKEVLVQARKFEHFYKRYAALHHEVTLLKDPPDDMLDDLLDMRARLANMKRDIYIAAGSTVQAA